jgi:Uma2 family endonuclease
MFRLIRDQLRQPDVAFVSFKTWPDGIPKTPISSLAPDLAVEVLSESNTLWEMERKRREFFGSGTRLVWVVDPEARTVDVFTDPETSTRVLPDQLLKGGDVLPCFEVRAGEFFVDLDITGPTPAQ